VVDVELPISLTEAQRTAWESVAKA
jgi:hypothetical protein